MLFSPGMKIMMSMTIQEGGSQEPGTNTLRPESQENKDHKLITTIITM